MTGDPNMLEAALLRTMTLLASLNVASEIVSGMRERKAGRDPSAEEEKNVALHVVQNDLQSLKALVFQLQSSLALSQDAGKPRDASSETGLLEAPVQRFIDLVHLQKAGKALHSIHQRLLSLYPAIHESIAEKARLLKNTSDNIAGAEDADFPYTLTLFINDARLFTMQLDKVLKTL